MNEQLILTIMDRFEAGSIGELTIEDDRFRLVLRKTGFAPAQGAWQLPDAGTPPQGQAVPYPQTGADASAPAAAPHVAVEEKTEMISSPIVATFYRAPAPDAPPFAEAGSIIRQGQALCVLEAMKQMNTFEAEFDCEILRILPESGSLVEFGAPLFEVRRI
jgi:acetyl-CoA carboxylase biotin carboxyl carrier protein